MAGVGIVKIHEVKAMAMQSQYSDDDNKLPEKRPPQIIDISPELRLRIKIAAAEKDLSIRVYVENILDQTDPLKNEHKDV